MRRILAYIPLLLVCLLPALGQSARAAEPVKPAAGTGERPEDLDREAKRLFTAGKYAEAIDLLNRLYRETNNPIYLRNIGRSYQRMRDPDRAMASFEEYLLRGRDLSATERDEVRGFIREMEALKRRQQSKAGTATKPPAAVTSDRSPAPPAVIPAPAAVSAPPPAVRPLPPTPAPIVTGPPPAPRGPGPAVAASAPAPFAPPPDLSPGAVSATAFPTSTTPPVLEGSAPGPAKRNVGRTVGVIAVGVAGVLAVGGGVALAMSWSVNNSAEGKRCGIDLICTGDADKVDRRNLVSMILLGSAAATGVLGATLILLNPVPAAGQDGRMAGLIVSATGRF